MWGHIQRDGQCEKQCSGCIRIFEDWQVLGNLYRYVFPFHVFGLNKIELHGIIGKDQGGRAPTGDESRAMLLACKNAGLRVFRERKSGAMIGIKEVTRHKFKDAGIV